MFNSDEFGLFFWVLPNKILELKGEKYTGGKHSKVRLTGKSAASAVGEKLALPVIENTKTWKDSRMWSPYHVCTRQKQKAEWIQRSSQIEWKSWTKIS